MTDTPRCEPPEELRRRDGWHWLSRQGCAPELIRWHLASDGETWLWSVPGLGTAGRAWMVAQGFRYIAPVTPPAEVDALRAERDEWESAAQELTKDIPAIAAALGFPAADVAGAMQIVPAIATLRAEVARLREALEPFAAVAQETWDAAPDGSYLEDVGMGSSITLGMCRIARAALSQPEGKE
jgi:hypothetical protein